MKNGLKTIAVTTRFKKLDTKFRLGIGTAFKDILFDIANEGVKKSLCP